MVKTTLIPFRKAIIVARLTSCFSITFGSGVKRHLKEDYQEFRATGRVYSSFPIPEISED